MVKVKVCGITNIEDAKLAVELGANALGFIFAQSPRQLTIDRAAEICSAVPASVSRVGVFVDCPIPVVEEAAHQCGLNVLQFHGGESPGYCRQFDRKAIKTFRVGQEGALWSVGDYDVDAFLLDTYDSVLAGGTGRSFDWNLAEDFAGSAPVIISGGLNPDNVEAAVRKTRPYAVDVCSGVESSPGKKDAGKLRAFLEAVQRTGGAQGTSERARALF